MLKSIGCVSVSAALLLSPVVFADDQPAGSRFGRLAVTVTVVRGQNTKSPEAAVQRLQCAEEDGISRCSAARPQQAGPSEPAEQPCTTTEQGTFCWY